MFISHTHTHPLVTILEYYIRSTEISLAKPFFRPKGLVVNFTGRKETLKIKRNAFGIDCQIDINID